MNPVYNCCNAVYHYNGNAVMVLIAILQRIYHRPYPELVTAYFQRNGIDHTRPALTKTEAKGLLMRHDEKGNASPSPLYVIFIRADKPAS